MMPSSSFPSLQVIELPIAGMTCAACSSRLEKNLNKLEGVNANVNLAVEKARVEFDPNVATPAAIVEQVRKTGFSVPIQTLDLAISGMTCASCSARLEKVLNQVPGVEARVNLATEKARLRYTPGMAGPDDLVAAVARAGFTATPITEADSADLHTPGPSVLELPNVPLTPLSPKYMIPQSVEKSVVAFDPFAP